MTTTERKARPIIQKTEGRKNQKLRDSAKHAPHCFGCWKPNPNGDLLCLAHSNRQQDGKGRGIKATDESGAILCQRCHDLVDGRMWNWTREEMQAYHHKAHLKTLDWWRKEGYLK